MSAGLPKVSSAVWERIADQSASFQFAFSLISFQIVPGLIAFCQQAKRIALPPLAVPPQSDRHIYADGVTGEVWYFGEDGKVHTTGPIPDRYSSKIANDLDRLVRAHESLLSIHGPAGETARTGLLNSIELAAALAKAKPG